jgi:hypothetical protein
MAGPPPSVVRIEELISSSLKVNRVLEMVGPGGPFRGAEWESTYGLATSFYPGNPEGTQHVLGPQEAPSEWKGEWKTTRMISAPSNYIDAEGATERKITIAFSMYQIVDSFQQRGSLLRVTWAADQGRRIVRLGRIKSLKISPDRIDDIPWSISFEWLGRGGLQQKVATFKQDNTLAQQGAINLEMNQLVADLEQSSFVSSVHGLPFSANDFSLGDLEALANLPGQLMKDLKQVVTRLLSQVKKVGDILATVASIPADIADQALDIAEEVAATLAQFIDQMSREVPEKYVTTGTTNVGQFLQVAKFYGGSIRQAQSCLDAAVNFREAVKARRSAYASNRSSGDAAGPADILGVYLAHSGETFASISTKFYGTPDNGVAIAKANGFPGYQVEPGRHSLIIPNLQALKKQ